MPTNETPTLLPCPFCGGEAEMVAYAGATWYVWCPSPPCEVSPDTLVRESADAAAAAWNTRHLDPATLALARLGAAVLGSRIEQRKALFDAADTTPGILDRVADLLDTEARERREDTP
jgi:hypothetical protein